VHEDDASIVLASKVNDTINLGTHPKREQPHVHDGQLTSRSAVSRTSNRNRSEVFDVICFSHLRWDFVHQRPQHLLTRCAQTRRVYFVEEPIFDDGPARLDVSPRIDNLWVVVPRLPTGLDNAEIVDLQRQLVDEMVRTQHIQSYALWYYTPMAMAFSDHLTPVVTVYDCMDELSAFAFAPPDLRAREQALLRRADLVFTGGHSLYEIKRHQHHEVYPFPSSVDVRHFGQARAGLQDPADQAHIPHPRLGFFGVIDERMDLDLINGLAARRPDWHIVLIGPVIKIDEAALPVAPNLHYLGQKQYAELPSYLANWDVAMLPFAVNASTRYISPTKTPEYLAAGKPVVSTPIHDVVRPYGERGLVRIAHDVDALVEAIEAALAEHHPDGHGTAAWLKAVDMMLSRMSWDRTWAEMQTLMSRVVQAQIGAAHEEL
jgi:glycosyltransferase involved in cell wall biosynthesis